MINKLVENIKRQRRPIVSWSGSDAQLYSGAGAKKAFAEFGETLEGAAEAIWQFNKEIVDKTYDLIPAVKPQIAMYEQFGIPGLEAFKKTVDYCKKKDLLSSVTSNVVILVLHQQHMQSVTLDACRWEVNHMCRLTRIL